MKNIPCLDSDFPTWDWYVPVNNTTTTSELKNALTALVHNGKTNEFTIETWNSMAEWLAKIYSDGGLAWDDKYGDIESIRLSRDGIVGDDSSILTAKRFNAITHNISAQIGTRWQWEYDEAKKGYVGRQYFQRSDYVYGWYILSLFDGINKMIDIARGTALDLEDSESLVNIKTNINAPLIAPKAGILTYQNSILTNQDAELYAGKAGLLNSGIIDFSKTHADFRALRTRPIVFYGTGKSSQNAELLSCFAPKLEVHNTSKTKYHADFYANVYVGRMVAKQIIKSNIFADLMPGIPFYPMAYVKEKSKVRAVLAQQKPYYFGSGIKEKSLTYGNIHLSEIDRMNTYANSESNESAVITLMHILGLDSGTISKTEYNAKLSAPRRALLYFMDGSFSKHDADMASLPVERIEAKAKEKSIYNAVVTDLPSMPVTASSNSDSLVSAEAVPIKPVYASGSSKSSDKAYGELISSNPRLMNGTAKEKSSVSAEPVTLQSRVMRHRKSSASKVRAEMKRGLAGRIVSETKIGSLAYADLTFYKEPGAWRDPEQRGSNLRIWNAYPQWQEGTNVHLDSGGVYYEPEQTGSNVYIRSTDSMKGDGIDG